MNDCPHFHVRKRTLLALAGSIWMIAGLSVVRLGLLSYTQMHPITLIHILLSLFVFFLFELMFYKMSKKHTYRINGYEQKTKPVWHFFDLKAYCIMAIMMGGGIWLRSSGLVPTPFISVFYTGLGLALAMASTVFWQSFFQY